MALGIFYTAPKQGGVGRKTQKVANDFESKHTETHTAKQTESWRNVCVQKGEEEKGRKQASCEAEEQGLGSGRRCCRRNVAEGAVPSAICIGLLAPCSEGSQSGAPKRQPCVLQLVCGCNNFVFTGARRLYSLAWVLPVLSSPPPWKRLKREKECTFITVF